jgi:rhodanese-related sulfurtransferase
MKNMKNRFLVFLPLLALLLVGCGKEKQQPKKTGLVVVNVLDRELYDDCHIKDSIHIPFESIEQCARDIDKNAEVVLYCSNYMCSTSEYAGKKLRELGFANVRVYEGGTAEWFQKGLPVEGPCQKSYLSRVGNFGTDSANSIPNISAYELAEKMGLKPDSVST